MSRWIRRVFRTPFGGARVRAARPAPLRHVPHRHAPLPVSARPDRETSSHVSRLVGMHGSIEDEIKDKIGAILR